MSIINTTVNLSSSYMNNVEEFNCGVMQSNFQSQVGQYCTIVSIALIFLIIFEWWALNRVMNGKLSHDEKSKYYSFIMVFIHSLILFGAFYLFYWIVLSGIDF